MHVEVERAENERGVCEWRQAAEQSTAETPALETKTTVSPASSDRGQHCFARRASLDITLWFWCFRVVCVGVLSEQRSHTRARMGHRPAMIYTCKKLQTVPFKQVVCCYAEQTCKHTVTPSQLSIPDLTFPKRWPWRCRWGTTWSASRHGTLPYKNVTFCSCFLNTGNL